ncbi:hypothetical protein [Maricaulis salignorans]|uniref:hypothetical protein n=1 Tax=Maricaulis salignorans TaxID=144026 RepID=UPI003A930CE6
MASALLPEFCNCSAIRRQKKSGAVWAPEKALGGWWGVFTGRQEQNRPKSLKNRLILAAKFGIWFSVIAEILIDTWKYGLLRYVQIIHDAAGFRSAGRL